MASTSVDLPVAFSPIMNVTFGWNLSVRRWRTTGNEKGYFRKDGTFSRRSRTSSRYWLGAIRLTADGPWRQGPSPA